MYPGQYSTQQGYNNQQQHHYPPPANAPYGAPPPQAYGMYAPPPPSPYSPYGTQSQQPPQHYAPPPSGPYGYPGQGYAPPREQPQYPPYQAPVYAIPQQMMEPQNVPPPPEGWAVRKVKDAPAPTEFKLSSCQGRKRALFIGINYFGQDGELRGCINDVNNIKTFIIETYGFKEEDMVILTDDQKDPKCIPTAENMLAAMAWLVEDAQPNDSFFFHYSGHGGQMEDEDDDEEDGFDEMICPVDYEEAGVITDDTMHEIMVAPLPAGCRLTSIMDCCHSGSALDLPYIYSRTGEVKDGNVMADVGHGFLNAGLAYLKGDKAGMMRGLGDLGKKLIRRPKLREHVEQTKSSPADCIMFSGCKDTQVSADSTEKGFGNTGAMTFSFITALKAQPQQSYLELLNSIRDILYSKYSQKPQLSSSHPVDLGLMFTM